MDSRFLNFWSKLQEVMGIRDYTEILHNLPPHNKTEKTKENLKDMLRARAMDFVGAYNDSYHESIGMAPYEQEM